MLDRVNIFAPGSLDVCDSYGLLAYELVNGLRRRGIHVNVFARGEDTDVVNLAYGGIFLGYPTSYEQRAWFGQIGTRIAVTMFESSKLPPGWVAALNRCSGVISPSTFFTGVLVREGVERVIRTVPLGVSDVYRPRKRELRDKFRVLAFGDRGKRKGVFDAMLGFVRAFGDSDEVELTVKTRNLELQGRVLNPNIRILSQDMSPSELAELYYQHHVLLFPSRGEGFGLPPREFAATGGVSLVTNWSGLCDDLNNYAWPLDYELVPADWTGARNLEGLDLGVWAKPDLTSIEQMLLDVYENHEQYFAEAIRKAAFVKEHYTWDKFVDGVWKLYEEM